MNRDSSQTSDDRKEFNFNPVKLNFNLNQNCGKITEIEEQSAYQTPSRNKEDKDNSNYNFNEENVSEFVSTNNTECKIPAKTKCVTGSKSEYKKVQKKLKLKV